MRGLKPKLESQAVNKSLRCAPTSPQPTLPICTCPHLVCPSPTTLAPPNPHRPSLATFHARSPGLSKLRSQSHVSPGPFAMGAVLHVVDQIRNMVVPRCDQLLELSIWQFSGGNSLAWRAQMHRALMADLNKWLTNNMNGEWRGIMSIVHQYPVHMHQQALLQVQLEKTAH